MAPNRRELAGIIDALTTIDVNSVVETKYLPLTHPDEQAQHDQRQIKRQQEQQPAQHHIVLAHDEQEDEVETGYVRAPHVSKGEDSYWDWPEEVEATEEEKRQNLIAKILAEEEACLAVSTATIEANLLLDAQRRKRNDANSHEYVTAKDEDAIVDYWDMPSEQDTPEEDNEVIQAQHVSDPDHPLALYWDWPAGPASAAARKQALIVKILEEENIRQNFMVKNIERNLTQSASANTDVVEEEKPSDRYWMWRTVDEADPNSSYWEWQSSTPGELRDRAVQLILAEEKIRGELAVNHLEENLRKAAANLREQEAEALSSTAQASGDDSYWDW